MLAAAGMKATTVTLETSNRKDDSNSMTVKTAGMKETTEWPTWKPAKERGMKIYEII